MPVIRPLVAAGLAAWVAATVAASAPSRYGRTAGRRSSVRENLRPVANPHPAPEPQPRRARPYDVVIGADGRKAYVTLQGSELEPGSEVAVVDLGARRLVRRIRLARRGASGPPASSPFRLALHPGGRYLVATSRFSNFAPVIDTRRDEVVAEIPLDFYCQGMAFSADGRTLWVANRHRDQVFEVGVDVSGGGFRAAMRQRTTPDGPGIGVGNPRSKPKICELSPDGRRLFVGNTGTQDISVVDVVARRDIGGIYIQNVVNDLKVYRSPRTGRELLLVTTLGAGFGVGRERDPFGGESADRSNPAAQYSLMRDLATGRPLPRAGQRVLGAFDAVDGTAGIKFRDVQNDLVVVDLGELPEPGQNGASGWLLRANRYEAHRGWTRYTSDTAESAAGDLKGDIPPDLMRVVGAFPERMAVAGDRLFVTMQGSAEVQEWRIDAEAPDPAGALVPVRTHPTGLQPVGIAVTPGAGRLVTANAMDGTLSIIDPRTGDTHQVPLDPSMTRLPFPATNAERGELVVHTAAFTSDGDTSCFHCHYFDMGDGRPWGVSQVVGQEYLAGSGDAGQLVIGGAMGVPQMRNLFATQPFFYEGTLSAFEPRSMLMEHCPADDFALAAPPGDFTGLEADRPVAGTNDVQSRMDAGTGFEAALEERRDAFIRRESMRRFGKAYRLRDLVRFVGEWQIAQPRLLPNPFDPQAPSVARGRALFESSQVGCAACHPAPAFTRKDFPGGPAQSMPPVVAVTSRDASFTLVGMNRLDSINGVRRDLEPWDAGRAEERQAHYTVFPLRGIWDRPPVFLHHGMARTLREVVCPPGHPALREAFRREPLLGGEPERPGRREVGFNGTFSAANPPAGAAAHLAAGGRIGTDTHGGTTQLSPAEINDLLDYLESLE